jgi:hypothetical protein
MKLPLVALVVSLPLLLAAACSSPSPEAVGASSSSIVSATTTYLLPVEDDVREACRSTWTNQWCNAGDAQAAGDACVATMLGSSTPPACASDPAGCFQLLTTATPCSADGPIYPTSDSCQAPVERTCAFYSACLEVQQPCGADGYALGYGEKYCSRFDVDDTFSPQGIAWRDAVLHCLQLALVPELPKADAMTCDDLTDFAFDSHPRCYTEGPSICFLPVSDVTNILGTIDGKDLLSLRSAKQMATVAATCVEQIAGALLDFDDDAVRARIPAEARDRAALGERLQLWQDVQRGQR